MNIEQMAQDCLEALAGLDTFDVDLRDHPQAWQAIKRFSALVRAQALDEAAEKAIEALHSPYGMIAVNAISSLKAPSDIARREIRSAFHGGAGMWFQDSPENRERLTKYVADCCARYGDGSYWIESREAASPDAA